MKFIQFYQTPVSGPWNNFSTAPIEACGDRSVIILDGRERESSHEAIARSECRKRGYVGFALMRGDTLARGVSCSRPLETL